MNLWNTGWAVLLWGHFQPALELRETSAIWLANRCYLKSGDVAGLTPPHTSWGKSFATHLDLSLLASFSIKTLVRGLRFFSKVSCLLPLRPGWELAVQHNLSKTLWPFGQNLPVGFRTKTQMCISFFFSSGLIFVNYTCSYGDVIAHILYLLLIFENFFCHTKNILPFDTHHLFSIVIQHNTEYISQKDGHQQISDFVVWFLMKKRIQ